MKLITTIAVALATAACGPSEPKVPGQAAAPPPQALQDDDPAKPGRTHVSFSFDELDLNDDGAIAHTESAFDAGLYERFATLDADGDGKLSRLEFDVARAAAAAR